MRILSLDARVFFREHAHFFVRRHARILSSVMRVFCRLSRAYFAAHCALFCRLSRAYLSPYAFFTCDASLVTHVSCRPCRRYLCSVRDFSPSSLFHLDTVFHRWVDVICLFRKTVSRKTLPIIRSGCTACSKNLLKSLFFIIMISQTKILNMESIL